MGSLFKSSSISCILCWPLQLLFPSQLIDLFWSKIFRENWFRQVTRISFACFYPTVFRVWEMCVRLRFSIIYLSSSHQCEAFMKDGMALPKNSFSFLREQNSLRHYCVMKSHNKLRILTFPIKI